MAEFFIALKPGILELQPSIVSHIYLYMCMIYDKKDSILNIRSTYLLVHYFVLSPKDVAFGGYGNVKSGSDSISHYCKQGYGSKSIIPLFSYHQS
jgi:hypothetical protein